MTTTERIAKTPNEQISEARFSCGIFIRKSRIFRAHVKGKARQFGPGHRTNAEIHRGPVFRFRSPSCEPAMTKETESPATLVAIIVAARRAGNRELEREMRRQLEQQFRVKLSFVREQNDSAQGVNDAK